MLRETTEANLPPTSKWVTSKQNLHDLLRKYEYLIWGAEGDNLFSAIGNDLQTKYWVNESGVKSPMISDRVVFGTEFWYQ